MALWRLLDTGFASGAFNMALDEVLVEGVAGRGAPVLRFFGWNPPAISFGYGQRPEVEVEKCRQAGIDLVRRLTGGRAVLHWEEMTYSLVCRPDDPLVGGRLEDTYRVTGECLVEGLRLFGVAAALERGRPLPGAGRFPALGAPCFSSAARWELKCQGRKLVGSAQRRFAGAVLQHGSLLIGRAHERLVELLALAGPERRAWACRLRQGSIHLQECIDRPVAWEELAACLAEGFARRLGAALQPEGLSQQEQQRAAQLAAEKYGNPLWTYGARALPAAPARG
jgi:lipoate-protein ligase A